MPQPSVGWLAGIPPAAKTPFVPAERFLGTGKEWKVWLLADVRVILVHYQTGQKSKPCVAHMAECPLCLHPLWWKRYEGYAPAMVEVRDKANPRWDPILAVLTEGRPSWRGRSPTGGRCSRRPGWRRAPAARR